MCACIREEFSVWWRWTFVKIACSVRLTLDLCCYHYFQQASQRVITRAAGKINTFTISNAPSGHYLYQYPDAVQKQRGNFGAKTFFYRTQLIEGTVKLETKLYTDYAWIARYLYRPLLFVSTLARMLSAASISDLGLVLCVSQG